MNAAHFFYRRTIPDWGVAMEQEKVDAEREKLRQHFLSLSDENQVNGWDEMWQRGVTPWDRMRSNPALVDALSQRNELFPRPSQKSGNGANVRQKAFVPGCGRGPDVLLFSSYGYDAYGLDASPTAVQAAEQFHRDQDKEQHFPVQNDQEGRGDAKFVEGDFFSNESLAKMGLSKHVKFDLIYDYTFLCALPPPLRPRWAARMSELLHPNGTLVCMEFPLGKDPKLGGPPHGLSHELYEQLFAHPGREVRYNLNGHVVEDRSGEKSDSALIRVETWHPERTFEGQEKSTKISFWRHSKK